MADHVCLKEEDLKDHLDKAQSKEEKAAIVKESFEKAGGCVYCRRAIFLAV